MLFDDRIPITLLGRGRAPLVSIAPADPSCLVGLMLRVGIILPPEYCLWAESVEPVNCFDRVVKPLDGCAFFSLLIPVCVGKTTGRVGDVCGEPPIPRKSYEQLINGAADKRI